MALTSSLFWLGETMTRTGIVRLILGLLGLAAVFGSVMVWRFSQTINIRPTRGAGSVAELQLPDGFEVNVFASGLDRPRFMAIAPDGTLIVAERGANRIIALPDEDADGVADRTQVFANELEAPHSIFYYNSAWYTGITSGIVQLVDTDGDNIADERTVLVDDFTTDGFHSTRTIGFLADGRMVVSAGSTCNVCDEDDPRRAAIIIYDDEVANGQERLFATGLRNAVGLALHPDTGELWVSNNGRDMMGDDLPPDTIRRVVDGEFYGWPRCHSGRLIDPDMGADGDCDAISAPDAEIQAHSAPLGLTFYDGDAFPPDYQGDLFIAYHGSWNRSEPTGYKIVRLDFENGVQRRPQPLDFAVGWLDPKTDEASGRPVDVIVGSDGALYVSDDKGGFIYRIAAR